MFLSRYRRRRVVLSARGSIRYKILFTLIPILCLSSAFIGIASYALSYNGITRVAQEFFAYQLRAIYNFLDTQHRLITVSGVDEDKQRLVDLTVGFAASDVTSYDRRILVLDKGGLVLGQNFQEELSSNDVTAILSQVSDQPSAWIESPIQGVSYSGMYIQYTALDLVLVLLDPTRVFYGRATQILVSSAWILGISIAVGTVLILFFAQRITSPMRSFVRTIEQITKDVDFSQRVRIYYPDEVGVLGNYFNQMMASIESAYNQIKNYALQTVIARDTEEQIRFVFQKYVPQDVINQVLARSEDSVLIGQRQKVSILFSDIRSFTSISEAMRPENLVQSLNAYFNQVVPCIIAQQGIVDKFIGDAIMAIFGAPTMHTNDADNAIMAAIQMVDALRSFNDESRASGRPVFETGIGINTGDCIVGNIGSEQKIDYTVIGDPVNLASRLEGLTKKYKQAIVISEFTYQALQEPTRFFMREIDTVRVKGKNEPVKLFMPYLADVAEARKPFYTRYHAALGEYYAGNFQSALQGFDALLREEPQEALCQMYRERCLYLLQHPPVRWDGVETWTEK